MITDQDMSRVENVQSQQLNSNTSQTVVLDPTVTNPNESTEFHSVESDSQQHDENIVTNESDWFLKEGVKGSGDRPEHLLEKFKTVEDQLKSYTELEKKLGSVTGSPEEYELNLLEEFEGLQVDSEDPFLQEFADLASDLNLNQEGFDALLNTYVKFASEDMNSLEAQENEFRSAELAKLGNDSDEQIKVLNQWIENQVPGELQEAVTNLGSDAESIKALQWLKDQVRSKGMPITENTTGHGLGSRIELADMMKDAKYGQDPVYTKMVDDNYKRFYS